MTEKLNKNSTVGDVVGTYPRTRQVFDRFGIDCRSGAERELQSAAQQAGLTVGALLAALSLAVSNSASDDAPGGAGPASTLSGLVDYVEIRHHAFLRRELPRLNELMRGVIKTRGPGDGEFLFALQDAFDSFKAQIDLHLLREENVLFPYLRQIDAYARGLGPDPVVYRGSVNGPIGQMESEHEDAKRSLQEMRNLTSDYGLPADASESFRALYEGLEALEADLQEHMRLENNVGRFVEDMREATAAKKRMESDLRIAREIQNSILPHRLPRSSMASKVALHVRSLAARQVGGDLHEFFFKDENTLVLAVGDVSGKGVSAALLMTMVWVTLKTFAPQENSPAAMLKRMNRALLQATGLSRFVTLFLAFYDTQSQVLRFANAGHCPPIVGRLDGSTEVLKSTSTALGVLDELESTEEQIQLVTGDRVAAYSDGITEARAAGGELFGFPRLRALMADGAALSLDTLLDNLMSSLEAHQAGQPQSDDMTIWMLEVE
ncbi:MAG: SpoIIE family protein phosphatase [Planctomycetes bacterium]|nr:SpoIIE family protein phosphatase [Planctomycetota bacterium]